MPKPRACRSKGTDLLPFPLRMMIPMGMTKGKRRESGTRATSQSRRWKKELRKPRVTGGFPRRTLQRRSRVAGGTPAGLQRFFILIFVLLRGQEEAEVERLFLFFR
jgi:hypothetical protein